MPLGKGVLSGCFTGAVSTVRLTGSIGALSDEQLARVNGSTQYKINKNALE